jgi:hypothetical protein
VDPDLKTYYIKVTPMATTEIPTQVFEVSLPSTESVGLTLHETKTVPLITNAVNSDDTLDNLDFFVEITRNDLEQGTIKIPGASPEVSTYMIPWTEEPSFPIRLLPGEERKYIIKITPQNDATSHFPPVYYDDVTVTSSGELLDSEGANINVLTAPESEVEVKGTIKFDSEVIDGLTIVAKDPETGRQLSTDSITGSLDGSGNEATGKFSLWLAPGVTAFTLVASRPSISWYPSFETDENIPPELTQIDLGVIVLSQDPLPSPVLYSASVEKADTWGDNNDVSYGVKDCLVIFESDDVFGGHAIRNTFTNAAGVITGESGVEWIYLYPADYSVTVIPPPNDSFYSDDSDVFYSEEDYQISGDSSGQLFDLHPRSLFQGHLLTEDTGAEVPAGLLRVEPLNGSPPFARTSLAQVESNSDFAIWVDSGDFFRFTMEAPPQSGYAWRSFSQASIDAEDREILLPIPFANKIELNLAGGSDQQNADKLKGAVLEFYEEVEETIIMVGRAVADENAEATVLLEP